MSALRRHPTRADHQDAQTDDDQARATAAVRAYHEATRHRFEGYAPSPGFLDWDSQPDPFRRFDGAPLIPLPFVSDDAHLSYQDLYAAAADPAPEPTLEDIAHLLELGLGLSAWKSVGPDRWALRNTPSSGNLHPTEAYLLLWRPIGDALAPGLYHYAPREHALEKRAALPAAAAQAVAAASQSAVGAIGLSSVLWREEWKYGARAYRYCQLDIGHALGALGYAARLRGWRLSADETPSDALIARCLGLDRADDFGAGEREHPELLALIGSAAPADAALWDRFADGLTDWRGVANRLSRERVAWPEITALLPAVKKPAGPGAAASPDPQPPSAPPPPRAPKGATRLIRQRRSAQRMDGATGVPFADFERMLSRAVPGRATPPLDALDRPPALNLLIFAHAVEGLAPGLYLLDRAPDRLEALRAACAPPRRPWSRVRNTALPLFAVSEPTDLRRLASRLSCHQGIAGRGAFSLGMLADFDHTIARDGPWSYRRLFWEAGLIGQALYLEAEAAGLNGTGVGCFFDDEVAALLGLGPGAPWRTLYHFTVGRSLTDQRLRTEPPYAHLGDRAPAVRPD